MDLGNLVSLFGMPILWAGTFFAASVGALAFVSPSLFKRVAAVADKRFSLQPLVALLERPTFDLDRILMPHVRLLGFSAIAAAASMALLISQNG